MINSNNFKVFWWGLLVIVMGIFLYSRQEQLLAGKPTYFDTVVFLVWISVCLAPIFKELKLFGLELKQDIEDLKNDIGHKLELMKVELQSSIEVSSSNTNHVHISSSAPIPATDSEIPDIKQQVSRTLRELGISAQPEANTSISLGGEISKASSELFKVRLSFEKLINSYARVNGIDPRRKPMHSLLRELQKTGSLPSNLTHGILEVLAICNYAIHGEDITDAQFSFVKDSAPGLYAALKAELETET